MPSTPPSEFPIVDYRSLLSEKTRQLRDAWARHNEELYRLALIRAIGTDDEELLRTVAHRCQLLISPQDTRLILDGEPILRVLPRETNVTDEAVLHTTQKHQFLGRALCQPIQR